MQFDQLIVIAKVTMMAACLSLLAACTIPQPVTTHPPTTTSIPTETPYVMCTPPHCWEDEVFSCPSKCLGGCGTVCSTRTPDPMSTSTPTMPPFPSICVMPTAVPGTPAPFMVVCAGPEAVHVGDTVQVAVEIIDLKHSDYINISGDDTGYPGGYFSAGIRAGGHSSVPINVGAHLRLDWVQSEADRLFLTLKAISTGPVKISFQVVPTMPDIQSSITITVLP